MPENNILEVDVLIIGAGPTGMSAALALLEAKKTILIIDKHQKGLGFSRAILMNPQTLASLAQYGVSTKITQRGIPISGMSVHGNKRQILYADLLQQNKNAFDPIALPQLETEQCMIEALEERGQHILKPFELVNFTQDKDGVTSTIRHSQNSSDTKIIRSTYVIGADGYHSKTRQVLGITYPTEDLKHKLLGVDCEMTWSYKGSVASWILNEGLILAFKINENKVRFVSIPASVLKKRTDLVRLEKITWETEFEIHFSQVLEYGKGRVWLAGDAAHAHSPVGGRGLNMGVADALRLVKAILDGDFVSYQKERYKVNSDWVKKNKFITKFLAKQGFMGTFNRRTIRTLLSIASFFGEKAIGKRVFKNITGT